MAARRAGACLRRRAAAKLLTYDEPGASPSTSPSSRSCWPHQEPRRRPRVVRLTDGKGLPLRPTASFPSGEPHHFASCVGLLFPTCKHRKSAAAGRGHSRPPLATTHRANGRVRHDQRLCFTPAAEGPGCHCIHLTHTARDWLPVAGCGCCGDQHRCCAAKYLVGYATCFLWNGH